MGRDRGRITRRQLILGAGGGALGLALAACGGGSQPAATVDRFRSRPDLSPPRVKVRGSAEDAGYTFVTPAGPLVVDDRGEPVWFRPVKLATSNLRVQRYRGSPVLSWWEGTIDHGVGSGECVLLDGSYRELARVTAGNGLQADLHELVVTGRDTAYLTAYRKVTADLTPVGGPRRGRMYDSVVQEIDIASGRVLFEWRGSDHISLSESHQSYQPGTIYDPVHVNSIDLARDGSLLVCARNTWAVYKVDPGSGRIVWRLGGKKSDFSLGPGVRFAWQHDARDHADGTLSLFDDEASPSVGRQSRGLLLDIDEGARRAGLAQTYPHPRSALLAGSQGSTQLLPGGEIVVGWGADPYYTVYGRDGTPHLDAMIEQGSSYRAFRFPWTGTPTEAPALAVDKATGGPAPMAYVSWNGATEVRSWRIHAGASSSLFGVIATAPRSGFETAVRLPSVPGPLVAEALDAHGRRLGISRPVD